MTNVEITPTAEEVGLLYDTMSPLLRLVWGDDFHYGYWLGPQDESSNEEATERFTQILIEKIGTGPSDHVLDVGCGLGKPALALAQATGARVLGISVNAGQVAEANARAIEAGLGQSVAFRYANAMDLPFADESFDAVWAFESFLHMDRPVALREIARVLRPGGKVVLTDLLERAPVQPDLRPAVNDVLVAQRLSSPPTLDYYRNLAAETNLVLDELSDISEHTKKTTPRLAQSVRRHRDEIRAMYGDQGDDIAEAMLSPLALMEEFGYLLLVAHKPHHGADA